MSEVKTCTKCGETKTLNGFNRKQDGKFGRRSECRKCQREESRAYRAEHQEEDIARCRAYRAKHGDALRASCRAYYAEHREEQSVRNRAYYAEHREESIARSRERYALVGRPHEDRYQDITAKYATRSGEPWSKEEDQYLATSTARPVDAALALHRSYASVRRRIDRLRRRGVALVRDQKTAA